MNCFEACCIQESFYILTIRTRTISWNGFVIEVCVDEDDTVGILQPLRKQEVFYFSLEIEKRNFQNTRNLSCRTCTGLLSQ